MKAMDKAMEVQYDIWAVLSDEQMSNKVGVEHQPDMFPLVHQFNTWMSRDGS